MSLKKIALVAVVLLAAVISFTIIAPWAADPVNHVSSIEKTENKISAVMTLSGGAAGASATLSVLPGDLCTPLATELAELAKYFLIILSALYLEKFLITISGYITFSVLIPLALIIVAAVIISGNKRFLSLAGKLAIIGVIIYLIVPASTMLSDKIYQTQEDTVAQTIEEYNNLDISGDSDSGIIGEITTITTNTIDKVTNFISDLTESLAVMIVTACIVPVLVFVLLVWIMKVMFYAGGNV
ncbi:hypothetical protein [Butyrivibrio sp. VCB2001]|uniref:hypothetical protein n=1 Tax=Butyrivibrio sp. VCB2001 TaxID=1280667 RepID=UPI00041523BF|nr:hypothetical protein [Butyrivibrio sp. VCB2001]